jgi:hypothetical protein
VTIVFQEIHMALNNELCIYCQHSQNITSIFKYMIELNPRPNESKLNTFGITLQQPHQGLTTFTHQTTLALCDKSGLNI